MCVYVYVVLCCVVCSDALPPSFSLSPGKFQIPNTKYTCYTGQPRNKLHLTNHTAGHTRPGTTHLAASRTGVFTTCTGLKHGPTAGVPNCYPFLTSAGQRLRLRTSSVSYRSVLWHSLVTCSVSFGQIESSTKTKCVSLRRWRCVFCRHVVVARTHVGPSWAPAGSARRVHARAHN